MDMTYDGLDRTLPVTLVRILRARQKVYSASRALLGWLKPATYSIEFGAIFATWTYRVMEPESFSGCFMQLRSAGLLPRTANALPSIDLNAIKVGSPC